AGVFDAERIGDRFTRIDQAIAVGVIQRAGFLDRQFWILVVIDDGADRILAVCQSKLTVGQGLGSAAVNRTAVGAGEIAGLVVLGQCIGTSRNRCVGDSRIAHEALNGVGKGSLACCAQREFSRYRCTLLIVD